MPRPDSTADRAALERYRQTMGELAALLTKAADLVNRLAEEDRR